MQTPTPPAESSSPAPILSHDEWDEYAPEDSREFDLCAACARGCAHSVAEHLELVAEARKAEYRRALALERLADPDAFDLVEYEQRKADAFRRARALVARGRTRIVIYDRMARAGAPDRWIVQREDAA